jgi:type I restriction enzyme S subunit
MSSWPTRKLGELCTEITVGYVGKMSDQYVDRGVPFLRSQDINPGYIDVSQIKYISPEFHQRLRKSALKPGDVAIVRTGYPGTASVIPATLPDANCADLVIARPGPDIDARFLAFALNSPWGKGQIGGRLVGAAQQHFNVKVAQALEFPHPPIETQRRIASILGAYDDLIEVNRRRVAVLEEMARGLFEEWFVRFRFPGHETVPIIDTPDGPLPEGWNNGVLGDMVQLEYGKALKADTRMPGPFPVFGSGGKVGQHNQALIKGPGIILGRKGNVGAVIWSKNDFWPIDTVYYVVSRYPLTYLYYLLHRLPFQNTDAAVPGLNRGGALKIPVAAPPSIICEEYDRLVRPIFALRDKLLDVIDALAASRDLLLPRLISGQLSVASAERELEKVA